MAFAWLAALASALVGAAWAAVPFNTPFQVVRPTPNHSSMVAVTEGLGQLAQHEGRIALVSVVGPYHSGKSFLLNALLQDTQAFQVGKKTSPETMGIWLCRTNLTASDGSEVWLMDSEGFFGPGIDEGYDAKVFTVATLVGAHVVYNTVKVIDQQAVGLLEMLIQRAQLFRTRSAAGTAIGEEAPDFLRTEGFPPMTWVVEDFVQELPDRFREEGATGWLRTYLEGSGAVDGKSSTAAAAAAAAAADASEAVEGGSARKQSDFLSKVFRDVRVHTLFLPATGRDQLRDLSRLGWNDLTEEFRTEMSDLRRHLLSGLQARQSSGKATTGASLAQAMQFIVRGLQQGMFHELPSLWGTWASQVAAVSLSDAEAWFASLAQRLDAGERPVPIATFNDRLDEARNSATTFYRALLRDFDVRPEVGELRRRMEVHLQERLVPTYHERIRRWVGERSTVAKENVSTQLETQSLPMDPAELETQSAQAAESAKQVFVSAINNFSALGPGRMLSALTGANGIVVQMPAFNPDPAVQLGTDLRTTLGARSLENERAVQHLFKQAVQAADEAVLRELRAVSGGSLVPGAQGIPGSNANIPLLSRGKVASLKSLAEQRCWRAFEDRLAPYSWAKSVSHYQASKAMVQADYLDARIAAFVAGNDQRLRAYFSAALDRALAAYVANRSSIAMPAAEADVEAGHVQLAGWAQDLLSGVVKELTDTDAFGEARQRFDSQMREGLQQVKEKNVEVWKAYSDEATRCAVAANRARERQCGWFCLFSNVPWAHQAASRHHLSDCLAKSAVGSRMAPPLRAQVFEAWYKKDMSSEAQRVRWRFYSWLGTIAALAFGGWWRFRRPRQTMVYGQYDFYSQPQQTSQFYAQAPSSYGVSSQAPSSYGISSQAYGIQGRAAAAAAACMPGRGTGPQTRFGIWRGGA